MPCQVQKNRRLTRDFKLKKKEDLLDQVFTKLPKKVGKKVSNVMKKTAPNALPSPFALSP